MEQVRATLGCVMFCLLTESCRQERGEHLRMALSGGSELAMHVRLCFHCCRGDVPLHHLHPTHRFPEYQLQGTQNAFAWIDGPSHHPMSYSHGAYKVSHQN